MKCKIFSEDYPKETEEKINSWLDKHPEIKIRKMTQTDSDIIYEWDGIARNKDKHATREFVVTIFFEEKIR